MKNDSPIPRREEGLAVLATTMVADWGALYDYQQCRAILETLPEKVILNTACCSDLFEQLGESAVKFKARRDVEQNEDSPSRGEMRARLKKLRSAIERMAECLQALDGTVETALLEIFAKSSDGGQTDLDMAVLGEWLSSLRQAIAVDLQVGLTKPHSGPSVPDSRKYFIWSLIWAWEYHTGDKAGYTFTETLDDHSMARGKPRCVDAAEASYKSPFLNFAEAAGRPVLGSEFRKRDLVESIKWQRKCGSLRDRPSFFDPPPHDARVGQGPGYAESM